MWPEANKNELAHENTFKGDEILRVVLSTQTF